MHNFIILLRALNLNLLTSLDFILELICDSFSICTEQVDKFSVNSVVIYDFGHFGEVPCEPFLKSHAESVNIFVHLVDEGNSLDNGLVLAINILSTACTGVAMTKTELSSLDVAFVYFY